MSAHCNEQGIFQQAITRFTLTTLDQLEININRVHIGRNIL